MISQYESGKRNPKMETLLKIADALGISINVFYENLSKDEYQNILEAKARKADRDNFDSVVNILRNLNDSHSDVYKRQNLAWELYRKSQKAAETLK